MNAQIVDALGRRSVLLENHHIRAVIENRGGMMPEFSLKRGHGGINSHWNPEFRDNSSLPFEQNPNAVYWKVKLLSQVAGDFLCSPNFGGGCQVDGVDLPPHGWAANEDWSLESHGVSPDKSVGSARFSMNSPQPKMPLSWTKCDLVLKDQAAYFSVMRIKNSGSAPLAINLTRHNTVGVPLLQAGCQISLCADRYQVAPSGTEFDSTGRLALGAEFSNLQKVPLRTGATVDLTQVPGIIGATDFVTGAVPSHLNLGWSCVVNPFLGLAYLCFFPGEAGLPEGEVALSFNDLWMQYGGRNFTPWALNEGGADRSFCLGTENAIGAYANGLEFSRQNPEILGRPTTVTIPAGGERKLCYGTALVELTPELVQQGIRRVEAQEGFLVLHGTKSAQRVPMDATFQRVRKFESGS